MLKIGKPRLETVVTGKTRLVSDIKVDDEIRTVWAEVDNEYSEYLCYERSDAFVIGLLHWAMRHGHDIECEAPMGEYLYYQITTELIDAVSKGSPRMHPIHIKAEVDVSELPCAGAVGTGISCGIDSLHVLACHTGTALTHHNLTHLAFNNVGSHGEGERAKRLYAERRRIAESFCREYGFKLTEVNSNIMDVFKQNHLCTHTYSSCFAIYCLQKLYTVYYYASSDTVLEFSLKDNDIKGSGFYDLLLLSCFSTDRLRIYSEGDTLSRLEKTRRVVDYTPSYKYLNVCLSSSDNCSRCEKCTRTLLALDALGRLEDYKSVFDIDYYRCHKKEYLITLLVKKWEHNVVYEELYPHFRKQLSAGVFLSATLRYGLGLLRRRIPDGPFRTFLRKVIKVYKRLKATTDL